MVINEDKKFIFIHVYKNGGSSMERALGGRTWTHGEQLHAGLESIINWQDYFSFAFIRNPWDRAVAHYTYANRHKKNPISFEKTIKNSFEKISKNITPNRKLFVQYNMVKNCSFIGRFEYIQEDFNEICKILNIETVTLPHLVKSKHEHYTQYYTPELKNIVYEKSAGDIEHFGFTFEGTATKNIGDLR